jgi:tetratricopeptide (TPR) repeat protein
MRGWITMVILGALMVVGAAGARADGAGDLHACMDSLHTADDAGTIAFCTRAAQASDLSPEQVASAWMTRAWIYYRTDDFDRAIEDYDRVIRMEPDFAGAYAGRADAYRGKVLYDRAIADFERSIELDPDGNTYVSRGDLFLFELGEPERALEDYDTAIRLGWGGRGWQSRALALFALGRFEEVAGAAIQARAYSHTPDSELEFLVYLSLRHGGDDGVAQLKWFAGDLFFYDGWERTLTLHYLGRLSESEVLPEFGAPNFYRSCEMRFYVGAGDLFAGRKAEARQHFEHVIDSCKSRSLGRLLAAVELSRL